MLLMKTKIIQRIKLRNYDQKLDFWALDHA